MTPRLAVRNTLGVALPLAAGAALGAVPAALAAGIGALNVAFSDSHEPYIQRARRMLAASVLVGGYLVVYDPVIVNEIGEITPDKVILGWIALALVMESCRRMTGWVLLIIAAVFVLYAHYSDFFPGMLNARSESWSKIAVHLYIDPNSLLGIPLGIVATIVVAFILFGQVLFASGGGEFFTDIAASLLGRFPERMRLIQGLSAHGGSAQ